jgi:GTP1/Obg family GTP-binding protein
MFGTGKSNGVRSVDVDWRKLTGLLEATDQRAAVKQSFPDVGQESFMSALRRIDPPTASEVMTAGNAWQGATELVSYPVIAIAGMLNSGKTSLVSTFLSPQGRTRTLRGVGNAQGTHRFVLWLPQR